MKKKNGGSATRPASKRATRKTNTSSVQTMSLFTAPSSIGTTVVSSGRNARIVHREMVASIVTVTGEFLQGRSGTTPGYDLNPGNAILFPWLSIIAAGYERYQFHKLKFDLVARNPTSVAGVVMMGFDYDWDDDPAVSASELGAMPGTSSANGWQNQSILVDCRRLKEDIPWKYVTNYSRMNGVEPRTVFGGFLQVGAAIGSNFYLDLYVTYDVELSLPQIPQFQASALLPTNYVSLTNGTYTDLPISHPTAGPSMPIVVPGRGSVPPIISPSGTMFNTVLDMRNLTHGMLHAYEKLTGNTGVPSAVVNNVNFDGTTYDERGTVTGTLSTLLGALTNGGVGGPYLATEFAVAGADCLFKQVIDLALLRIAAPAAAFLGLHFFSSLAHAAEAGNTALGSVKFEL